MEPFASALIVGLEMATAAAFAFRRRRAAAALGSVLALGIVATGAWRLTSGLAAACPCFGNLLRLSAHASLVMGAALLVASLAQAVSANSTAPNHIAGALAPLSALALAFGFHAANPTPTAPASPRPTALGVYLESPLGRVTHERGETKVSFRLVNGSTTPRLVQAKPSCGCARGSWGEMTLRAGQGADFVTRGSRPDYVLFRISSSRPAYLYGAPGHDQ